MHNLEFQGIGEFCVNRMVSGYQRMVRISHTLPFIKITAVFPNTLHMHY